METNLHTFFNTLFDPGQALCLAKHSKGTKVYDLSAVFDIKWANFFTINALHPTMDLNPTEEYHSADKPRRADHNVVCYRNILVEMDSVALDKQEEFIEKIGMPYSTSVYSGGKSIHYIISLVTPVTADELRTLSDRVYNALGGRTVVDTSCKNPSRLSRFPDADRDGVKQDLLEVKGRVENDTLIQWLNSKLGPEVKKSQFNKSSYKGDFKAGTGTLNGFTLHLLMFGAEEGQRNSQLFKAACDFAKCGYEREDAIQRLGRKLDLPQDEIVRTVKSAYRKVEADQSK